MRKYIFIAILFLFLVNSCTGRGNYNQQLEGPFKVVKIVDGDTFDLNNSNRVRLSGINTPETGECYYQEAKDKLEDLILGKDVYLEKDISNTGKYGRLLRYVYVNGIFVNGILVKEGYAKVYDKYKEDTRRYSELKEYEESAVMNSSGVWKCKKLNCLYVRSKNSNIYHKPECNAAKRIKPENLICYKTEEEIESGLRAAKVC